MNNLFMWMAIFLTVTGAIYAVAVISVTRSLAMVRCGQSTDMPVVTVVIAARNERIFLGTCLAALVEQSYPQELIEVIVVDDRSNDGTSAVAERFRECCGQFSCIRIDSVPNGISPKKHALTSAIASAYGNIILQTDADCVPPTGWIAEIVRGFEPDVGMVVGVAPYFRAPGLLNSFVRHEYIWNASLATSSIIRGRGTHASGRNLAFRRDVFDRIGGYGDSVSVLSGDDTLLLHRIRRKSNARIVSVPTKSSHVYTHAPGTFSAFIHQRVRHMSTGTSFDTAHILLGLPVYGFHLLLVMALAAGFFSRMAALLFIAGFAWKCLWDVLVALRVKAALHLETEWRVFVLNELLLVWYMGCMPLLGSILPVKWKEKG
ncbi:glycosyltransferase [Candidatus Latescibacterota bacterium]